MSAALTRRHVHALLLFLLGVLLTTQANAQSLSRDACTRPIFSYAAIASAERLWEDQSEFTWVRTSTPTGDELRIVGDIIRINPENFPFFARSPDRPITGYSHVIFDAREIYVEMQLRVAAGSISLYADKVAFIGPGGISMPRAPERAERIEIKTRELDLARAGLTIPLEFTTRDWAAATWPKSGGPSRQVIVRAQSVSVAPSIDRAQRANLTIAGRHARFINNLTLDARHSRPGQWESMYDVQLTKRKTAKDDYEAVFQALRWPEYTAYKLASVLAHAPYDPRMRQAVGQRATAYADRFSTLADPMPLLRVEQVRSAISNYVDMDGLSAYDVSFVSLPLMVDRVDERIRTYFGAPASTALVQPSLMAVWDEVIVDTLAGRQGEDARRIAAAAITTEVRSMEARAAEIEELLQKSVDGTSTVVEQINVLMQQIAQQRGRVLAAAQTRAKQLRDARRVADATKIVQASAVAVGTVFPAAAPVAMGISEGLTIAGTAVAASNSGGAVGFKMLVATFEEVHKEHEEHRKRVQALRVAWNGDPGAAVGSPERAGLKRSFKDAAAHVKSGFKKDARSVERFVKSGRALSDLVQGIQKALRPAGQETALMQIPTEAADPQLQRLWAEVSKLRQEEADARKQIEASGTEHERLLKEILSRSADLDRMLTATIEDTRSRQRRLEVALWHRHRAADSLRSDAALLLRGFRYYTGTTLELPERQASFYLPPPPQPFRFDKLEADEAKERLSSSRKELAFFYHTLIADMKAQLQKVENAQPLQGPTSARPFFAGSLSGDSPEAVFLRQLNSEIGRQVMSKADNGNFIQIPYVLESGPVESPERVLDAFVSEVAFHGGVRVPAGTIRFEILHPGAGAVYFRGECVAIRSMDDTLSPKSWYFPPVNHPLATGIGAGRVAQVQAAFSNQVFMYRFPYRTVYQMRVRVLNPELFRRSAPPQLTSMRVDFVYVGGN